MKPSYCTISDEVSTLQEFHELGNWRSDARILNAIRISIINLFMIEEGYLTDEEEDFLTKAFLDVTQHEAETR
jgi:hypothetical protein